MRRLGHFFCAFVQLVVCVGGFVTVTFINSQLQKLAAAELPANDVIDKIMSSMIQRLAGAACGAAFLAFISLGVATLFACVQIYRLAVNKDVAQINHDTLQFAQIILAIVNAFAMLILGYNLDAFVGIKGTETPLLVAVYALLPDASVVYAWIKISFVFVLVSYVYGHFIARGERKKVDAKNSLRDDDIGSEGLKKKLIVEIV